MGINKITTVHSNKANENRLKSPDQMKHNFQL